MPISADSLLNKLRAFDCKCRKTVKVLGVDDFSFRRGKTLGTILVDLETHTTLDLLEDRSATTLTKWLQKHPEIEIISRDRSKEYARGASEGAPQAQQVADRWHLLVNLSDVIEKWLERHRKDLIDPDDKKEVIDANPFEHNVPSKDKTNYFVKHQLVKLETRARRFAQYQQAKELRAKGLTWNLVAAKVGKGSATLRRWFREGVPNKDRGSIVDPYIPYLNKRIQEGCQNALQLHREVEQQGYEGSVVAVQKYVALYSRGMTVKTGAERLSYEAKRYTPREAVLLFTKDEALLTESEKASLEYLKQNLKGVDSCHELSREFINMVQQADSSTFDSWHKKAQVCSIKVFRKFANGICNDQAAVKAGIDLPWSNGVVEGKVNKLKLIKRQMYGRASFDLLRKRVILAG